MKKFIIILFAVFFTGCIASKQVSNTNIKSKCDYYMDNIEKLYTEPFDNATATGIVCDVKNNKSYIPIKNGLAHGKAEIYYDNGTSLEINFEEGKRIGETKTFQNGILISSFNFMQDGGLLISFYHPNGQLDYSIYNNNEEMTLFRKYNSYGNLIEETSYSNGRKNGVAKSFYSSGALKAERFFIDDKIDGVAKIYYENGTLNAEMFFRNNILDGTGKEYYENGILKSESFYKNGKITGSAKLYYENGALKAEDTFKNGKRNGVTNIYNQNGTLDKQVTYKDGQKNGPMKKYNSDGSYWATITYQNNNPVSGKCANGRKWNNAELSNWKNGLSVDCGY